MHAAGLGHQQLSCRCFCPCLPSRPPTSSSSRLKIFLEKLRKIRLQKLPLIILFKGDGWGRCLAVAELETGGGQSPHSSLEHLAPLHKSSQVDTAEPTTIDGEVLISIPRGNELKIQSKVALISTEVHQPRCSQLRPTPTPGRAACPPARRHCADLLLGQSSTLSRPNALMRVQRKNSSSRAGLGAWLRHRALAPRATGPGSSRHAAPPQSRDRSRPTEAACHTPS